MFAQSFSAATLGHGKSPPASLKSFQEVIHRLEQHVEKNQISGRYHRLPKMLTSDYELSDTVLGSGANGDVHLATSKCHHNHHNHRFAVKEFNFKDLPPEKKAQLECEVEVFLTMDHPHIARLTDVYESAEHLDIVMECMEGGELFDRIKARQRFSERDTANSVWQMLLALNYIHSHGIIHGDIKLENFMYDSPESDHIKLIDFGFSKMNGDSTSKAFGTLSYVAPEMLELKCTSRSDMWSLGVIVFVLLSGYMPFRGSEQEQLERISTGKFLMKKEKWAGVSVDAIDFTRALLRVDPTKRLTAQSALEHPFIANRHIEKTDVDPLILQALRDYGYESKFRQSCLSVMAWCLSNEDRHKVEEDFLAMDEHHHGTITYEDLKKTMVQKFGLPRQEVNRTYRALSDHKDHEIHYSDFLAAMVSKRIGLNEELLQECFSRFDVDNTGYITAENMRSVLGDRFHGQRVESLLREVDTKDNGRVSYHEFASYMGKTPLHLHGDEHLPDPITHPRDHGHLFPDFYHSLRHRRHHPSDADNCGDGAGDGPCCSVQ